MGGKYWIIKITGYIKAGIPEEHIYVVTEYMSEMIHLFLQKKYPKAHIVFSVDYVTTNNMYSLHLALKILEKETGFEFGTMFINNADCLYDESLINELTESEYKNAIACEMGVYIDESIKIFIKKNNVITNIAKTIHLTEYKEARKYLCELCKMEAI